MILIFVFSIYIYINAPRLLSRYLELLKFLQKIECLGISICNSLVARVLKIKIQKTECLKNVWTKLLIKVNSFRLS